MKFSQRQGLSPAAKVPQVNSIDEELINRLWNVYTNSILYALSEDNNYAKYSNSFKIFFTRLFDEFFKKPIDESPVGEHNRNLYIKRWFYEASWFEVYDLIEFSLKILNNRTFMLNTVSVEQSFNKVFEQEFSGYRFIDGVISPITNEHEITELKTAINITQSFSALDGCNIHLKESLAKISDKKNPDYRNSIKESISAVESLVKVISDNPKGTLGNSLGKLKNKVQIHSSLIDGLNKIYGYTSDEKGIRHALMEETACDFEDAQFMLISCSSFVNYLITKATKSGLKL